MFVESNGNPETKVSGSNHLASQDGSLGTSSETRWFCKAKPKSSSKVSGSNHLASQIPIYYNIKIEW